MGPSALKPADLPRAIRRNSGVLQFVSGRVFSTAVCIAMVLFGEFYWPVAVIAGMAAAQVWMLTKRAHKRDGNPYRPISAYWEVDRPAADIASRVAAALASDEWRRIKRCWYFVATGLAVAVWVGSPVLKRALAETEPRQPLSAFSLLVLVVSFYAWITLMHYWYATLQARFLRKTLLTEPDASAEARR